MNGLSTSALSGCDSVQGPIFEGPWNKHRLTLCLTVSSEQHMLTLNYGSPHNNKEGLISTPMGFQVQFEVNQIFVFSVSP